MELLRITEEFYEVVSKNAAKYKGKNVVIKFGGELVAQPEKVRSLIKQAINLVNLGANVVMVHGGGVQIEDEIKEKGFLNKKVDGLRVNDEDVLNLSDQRLSELNREIGILFLEEANRLESDVSCLPMAGYTGNAIKADPAFEGYLTGTNCSVNSEFFENAFKNNCIPIVYPICLGKNGERMSVNADEVASSIILQLGGERLVLCTNTPGVLDKEGNRIPEIVPDDIDKLIQNGTVTEGMIPKLRECLRVAQDKKVGGVVILDGNDPRAVAQEILTDEGAGTLIRAPIIASVTQGLDITSQMENSK